jgi:hypothetical protein
MTINTNYEVSSEGAVRHWEINFAVLEHNTPEATHPFAVISRTPGTQVTGTVLTVDDTNDVIIGDVTHSMVYRHNVRNVRTYNMGAEATWGTILEGDPVYYDRSATMPAGTFLSTSPLDNTGAANPLFGFAVLDPTLALTQFPKAAAGATTATDVAVMQEGA